MADECLEIRWSAPHPCTQIQSQCVLTIQIFNDWRYKHRSLVCRKRCTWLEVWCTVCFIKTHSLFKIIQKDSNTDVEDNIKMPNVHNKVTMSLYKVRALIKSFQITHSSIFDRTLTSMVSRHVFMISSWHKHTYMWKGQHKAFWEFLKVELFLSRAGSTETDRRSTAKLPFHRSSE